MLSCVSAHPGKSTLLKCIAMALSGPTVANQQLITPAGWVRRDSSKGQIEVKVQWGQNQDQFRSGGAPPGSEGFYASLQFEFEQSASTTILKARDYRTPKGTRVQTSARGPWNAEAVGWFLSAYGPLRRLTGSSTEALRHALGAGKLASCVTLFREDAALSESETWLKQEHARTLEQQNQGRPASPLVGQVQQFLNDGLLPDGFRIASVSVDDVRRLKLHEQERVTLGRAEKVLLGDAFGLKQTWGRQAEKLVQRWETLAARRNADGNLPSSEQSEFDQLAKQMEIVFDDDPSEALNA